MPFLEDLLTAVQIAVLAPLAVLGLHRGWLVLLCLRHRPTVAVPPLGDEALPSVTVQLPIYNERYVVERLLRAVAALDYPRNRLAVQVLDDSDDDTSVAIATVLGSLPADLEVAHIRRTHRTHFKAGALAAGLAQAHGELIALFDADFTPAPEFLRRAVPWFADPGVGLVQARWEHRDATTGWLQRIQALLLDGHFAVEHAARANSGRFFNFNGTAGVFRRRCIEDAGGWQGDSLTEDLDLSYRAQLRGWRFLYRQDLTCAADLPDSMDAFLNQQHRWAKGAMQTARKLLLPIWRSHAQRRAKVEATFHLLGNLAFPLLLTLIVVALPLQLLRWHNETELPPWLWWVEGAPMLAASASVLLYYGAARQRLRRRDLIGWLGIPLVLAIGAGLSRRNTAAVLSGALRPIGAFERTPKLGAARRAALDPRYVPRRNAAWWDASLGLWAAGTTLAAITGGEPLTALFHGLFAVGLLWVGVGSFAARAGRARRHARPPFEVAA